ncbi:MAG: hypothetical protein ACK5NT_05325 [Pyrinomonadaceae bacterium]
MGKSYISLLIVLLFFSIQLTKAEERLKLSGQVESIEIEDKKDVLQIDLQLKMSLKLVGKEAIFLWKQTYPHDESLRNKFLCVNFHIFGILSNVQTEKLLFVDDPPLPSLQRTKQWQDVVTEMDKKSPPSSQFQIVKSGETVYFFENLSFVILKKKAIGSNNPYWGYGSDINVLADEILKAKNLTLQVSYRVWSSELEPRSDHKDKKPFGKKLQKRWKKFGYLWLDDIVSEPIPLDLSSAVIKTDSKP